MLGILAHLGTIAALWPVLSFAVFTGLQVEPLYGNIGIGVTVALAAAYVYFGVAPLSTRPACASMPLSTSTPYSARQWRAPAQCFA